MANYGVIAAPLTQLLKDAYVWSDAATEAFKRLKHAVITLPVLTLPDFSQPFIMETNASGTGLGAVLSQGQRPIAFFSQTLSPSARYKLVYERELMAIVLSVQRWRPYLLGQKFLVCTDQQALKFLLEQKVTPPDYQRWVSKLLGYDFEIQYRPVWRTRPLTLFQGYPPRRMTYLRSKLSPACPPRYTWPP